MAAATARERHAARTRVQRAPALPQRRISGPVAKPHAAPAPQPATGVFERLRGLADHRIIDRLLRGRAWICFVGLALMGIVAMQVSLLKLNAGIGRAIETTATLERQNSQMEASIARLASGERTRAAADRDGMVTPAAGAVHYLRVRNGGDAARAARRMRAPSEAARELMANGGVVPGSLVPAPATTIAAPATAAAPATTAGTTAAAPAVTPTPTPAAATPVQPTPTPTTTAPTSGGTVAAAPTQPQG
jgi:hypothetical protein